MTNKTFGLVYSSPNSKNIGVSITSQREIIIKYAYLNNIDLSLISELISTIDSDSTVLVSSIVHIALNIEDVFKNLKTYREGVLKL
jgi:flagellar assembly factor FliW